MSVTHECDRNSRHGEPDYCLCERCHEDDVNDAYAKGKEDGFKEGRKDGYDEGYEEGRRDNDPEV